MKLKFLSTFLAICSLPLIAAKVQTNRLNYGAVLYKDSYLRGSSLRIHPNWHYSHLGWIHDEVSSLEVGQGCIATVYMDSNYLGPSTTFTAGTHTYVGNFFNDAISSIKVDCN